MNTIDDIKRRLPVVGTGESLDVLDVYDIPPIASLLNELMNDIYNYDVELSTPRCIENIVLWMPNDYDVVSGIVLSAINDDECSILVCLSETARIISYDVSSTNQFVVFVYDEGSWKLEKTIRSDSS